MPKKNELWKAIGRRKSSVARVSLSTGKGKIIINKRDVKEYFGRDTLKMMLDQPLDILEINGKYDISVNVNGGGLSGQAGAIRLGIARCLEQINLDYRSPLKNAGMLTRDSREVERKKYGQPGARKRFQFSKR
ncbi:MAG: 30S ribosomal protein S9 [Candidatus Neomarinimicrobiota bacterium]|nr:30S ribosomal protein S9 [Candidatus Neomarinimicrobiota bacterium]|tara:strand:+ start:64 stop:462 length:399 start_codon:yes stop_codon:yes gene_type:complete